MPRTDPHRPSALDPADYVNIGWADLHPEDGGGYIEPEHRGAPSFEGNFTRYGRCDHCGTGSRLRYANFYLHRPSGEVVTVGTDCAERLDLDTRQALEFQERARAQGKADRIEDLRRRFPTAVGVLDAYAEQEHRRSDFLSSLLSQLRRKAALSPKQIMALCDSRVRQLEREAEQRAREAAAPPPAPVPDTDERVQVTGTIISVKIEDGDYGTTEKMLVQADGYRLWGTRPQSLLVPADEDTGWIERDGVMHRPADRGDRVSFMARVQRSDRDENFGFFSRPTKAEYLGPEVLEGAEPDPLLVAAALEERKAAEELQAAIDAEAAAEAYYDAALAEDADRTFAAQMPRSADDALLRLIDMGTAIKDTTPHAYAAAVAEAERRGIYEGAAA